MKTCSVCHWNQNKQGRGPLQFITLEIFIYLPVYLYRTVELCLLVKETAIEKQYQPTALTFFGSVFGVLFCLLIRKLILGSKTI